ncbi:hypothetical protein [Nonlabens xiamenensis]|uniref:hypothetical protein n=1 Tax=Nonlabens xiamenensis TaxID=2341043 RepID=UPI000F60E4E1|nr:hypothetical protein [Nonlabens xiamenensis]
MTSKRIKIPLSRKGHSKQSEQEETINTRIEYRKWNGVITEQQALTSGESFEKIYYTNNIRDRMEDYDDQGTLYHFTHYKKNGEDETALVASFAGQYNHHFSIVERTAIGPYFREREREYNNDGVLFVESDSVELEGQIDSLCIQQIYDQNGFDPDEEITIKQFELEATNRSYAFFYHPNGSFRNAFLTEESPWVDEETEYNNFSDIEFPLDIHMPIKKEYFLTDAVDPTGFEPD